MNFYHLIASIGLGSLARSASAYFDCSPSAPVNRTECLKALSKIIYQPDKTLDRNSLVIQAVSGDCLVIVNNLKKVIVTKQQIEATAKMILDRCTPAVPNIPDFAGGSNVIGCKEVLVNLGDGRNSGPYRPDFPMNKVVCGLNIGADTAEPAHCRTAYDSFNVDDEDHFMTDNWNRSISVTKTYKTCAVYIYTTDESTLYARKSIVSKTFEKMIDECKGQSGVVNVKGGAAGLNGHTIVKIRNSMPCRGKTEAAGQICG